MKNEIDLDYALASELIDEIKEDPMGDWYSLPDFPEAELERLKSVARSEEQGI